MPDLPAALPAGLAAHGVGNRQDLPLPFVALLVGAAIALLVSFVALGLLWREPRLGRDDGRELPRRVQAVLDSGALRGAATGLALLLAAWTLLALVAGRDDANNPVAHVVYVWLWVGLAFLSMVFGPVWRVLNPLRRLRRGLGAVARIGPEFALAGYRWGYLPAAAGLFAFTWLELVAEDRTTLLVLRVAVGGFLLLSVMGSLVFGPAWFERGDPFEVWSRLYGTLSPLGRRRDGAWVLRTPLHGPLTLPAERGLVATVAVMLGGTAYDSLTGQVRFAALTQSSATPVLLRSGVLLGTCLLVASALHAAAGAAARVAGLPASGVAARFAPSLLPVAGGYLVAHYWSLWAFQGPLTWVLLTDPLGIGANWLGTAGVQPNAALIAPGLVAVIQAGSIVIGHVIGVVAAHERAVNLLPAHLAVAGQVPLMVLMVAFTVGGLTLLFST